MFTNLGGIEEIRVAKLKDITGNITRNTGVVLPFTIETAGLKIDSKEMQSATIKIISISCIIPKITAEMISFLDGYEPFDLVLVIKDNNEIYYQMGDADVPVRMFCKYQTGTQRSNRNQISLDFDCEAIKIKLL